MPMPARTVLFLLCTVLVPSSVLGQIQRLIIASADVSIEANGSAIVKTYCTDYGVMGPKQNQEYRHLLTSGDSTRVTVGGKEITLQEAIESHKVKLVTPKPTVDSIMADQRMFKALNPDMKIIDYAALLKLMTPQERNRALAEFQNESALKIINISGEKLEFHARNAALGVSDAPPPAIPENTGSQTALWVSQIQNRLKGQGYDVQTNGVVDSKTESALKGFQLKYGFKQTGTATQEVAQKLAGLEEIDHLKAASTDDFVILRLENHPSSKKRLEALDLNGSIIYHGNEIHALVNTIAVTASQSGKTVYVDPINFTARQIEDLGNSFRMADAPIGLFPKSEKSSLARDVFLSKGVRFDRVVSESREVLQGPKKGWFHSIVSFVINFHGRVRELTAEVWTRTSVQMSNFLQSLDSLPGQNFDETSSVAMIVARGRKSIVSNGGKAEDMDVQIESATHRFWAHLEMDGAYVGGM
jgi:hypothetical protein